MRNLYYTDNDPETFYTAVFDAYADENAYLFSSPALQTALCDNWIDVIPNHEKATRVIQKIQKIDRLALCELDYILRSNDTEKDQIAFLYLRLLVKEKRPVRTMLSEKCVREAMDIRQKVSYEVHRLKGFLRFQETVSGVFYSPCSPDHNVLDLLMPHFTARFKIVPFVIHDVKRNLACIYNGNEWILTAAKDANVMISEREDGFSQLWKKYYKTVAIPARKNEKLMNAYMPRRYHKFMTEKQDELP